MKPTLVADEMFPEGAGPYVELEEVGGSRLLVDLTASEKAVHAEFFNAVISDSIEEQENFFSNNNDESHENNNNENSENNNNENNENSKTEIASSESESTNSESTNSSSNTKISSGCKKRKIFSFTQSYPNQESPCLSLNRISLFENKVRDKRCHTHFFNDFDDLYDDDDLE